MRPMVRLLSPDAERCPWLVTWVSTQVTVWGMARRPVPHVLVPSGTAASLPCYAGAAKSWPCLPCR